MRQLVTFFDNQSIGAGVTTSAAFAKQPGLNIWSGTFYWASLTGGTISCIAEHSLDSVTWSEIKGFTGSGTAAQSSLNIVENTLSFGDVPILPLVRAKVATALGQSAQNVTIKLNIER